MANTRFRAAIGTFKSEVRQADALPVARMASDLQGAIERAEAFAPGHEGARVEALDLASKFVTAGYGRRKVEEHMSRKPSTLQRYFTVARAAVKQRAVPDGYKSWRDAWQTCSLRELVELCKTERMTPAMGDLLVRAFRRTIRAIQANEFLFNGDTEEWHGTNLRELVVNYLKTGEMHEHALSVGEVITDEQTLKIIGSRFDLENN